MVAIIDICGVRVSWVESNENKMKKKKMRDEEELLNRQYQL